MEFIFKASCLQRGDEVQAGLEMTNRRSLLQPLREFSIQLVTT